MGTRLVRERLFRVMAAFLIAAPTVLPFLGLSQASAAAAPGISPPARPSPASGRAPAPEAPPGRVTVQASPTPTPTATPPADDELPVREQPPRPVSSDGKPPQQPTEILVKFKPAASDQAVQTANAAHSAAAVSKNPVTQVHKLRVPAGTSADELVRRYQQEPLVEWAEPNGMVRVTDLARAPLVPNDTYYAPYQQWYFDAMQAPAGWEVETGDSSVVIAVLDSGVGCGFSELINKIWRNSGEIPNNGIDDDGNGFVDDVLGWDFWNIDNDPCLSLADGSAGDGLDNDGDGVADGGVFHGTAVAAIAGATTNNSRGMAGMCWGCRIMAVRVMNSEGWGFNSDIADGIIYAARNGARVINLSLGGEFSRTLQAAVNAAHDVFGATIVAAAGNSNTTPISYPAQFTATIAVGSVDCSPLAPSCPDGDPDGRAAFSNWGTGVPADRLVDLVAPGKDLFAAYVCSVADALLAPQVCPSAGSMLYSSGFAGTSFSAPLVSGAVGLILSRNPSFTNEQVRVALKSTAWDLPDDPDDSPDAGANWDGAGMLQVGPALTAAPGLRAASVAPRATTGDGDLRAGASGQYTIAFTPAQDIPQDGRIEVDFPAGFNLTQVALVAEDLSGSATVSTPAGTTVRILRNNDGAAAVGGTPVSLTVGGIVNPASVGLTDTFALRTQSSTGALIDAGVAPAVTLVPGTIAPAAPSVVLDTAIRASANVGVTVQFIPTSAVPADARIDVTFPAGFTVASAAVAAHSLTGGFAPPVVMGQTVTLSRDGTGQHTAAFNPISITLAGVANPTTAGATGQLGLRLASSANVTLGLNPALGAAEITDGTLSAASVVLANPQAGATGNLTLTVQAADILPQDARMELALPAGFATTGAAFVSSTVTNGSTWTVTSPTSTTLRLDRSSATGPHAAGAPFSVVVSGVRNPAAGGVYTFAANSLTITAPSTGTRRGQGAPGALTVSGGAILDAAVSLSSNLAGATGVTLEVSFATTSGVGADHDLVVVLPAGMGIGTMGTVASSPDGSITGITGTAVADQGVRAVRSGGNAIAAGVPVKLRFTNITNPAAAGATGSFTLCTRTDSTTGCATVTGRGDMGTAPGVAIAAATPSGAQSTLVADPVQVAADGTSAATVTVTLRDAAGTPLRGQRVSLASDRGAVETITALADTTDAEGRATFTVTSRTPGAAAIRIAQPAGLPLVATVTFTVGGVLTEISLDFSSLVAGATSSATVRFTTAHPIPADGKITVVFPAGFTVAQAALDSVTGLDGDFTLTASGQALTVSRDGTGQPAPADTAVTVVLTDVVNPPTPGPAGDVALFTLSAAGEIVDEATIVGVTIATSITLTPDNGALGTAFQVRGGSFQAGETVSLSWGGAALGSATAGQDGAIDVALSVPADISLTAPGHHAVAAQGATSGIPAAAWFEVAWEPPALLAFPSNASAGATSEYMLLFALSQAVPAKGRLILTFPRGFDLSQARIPASRSLVNLDLVPSLGHDQFGNPTATFTVAGRVAAGSNILWLAGVVNPTAASTVTWTDGLQRGGYALTLTTRDAGLHDLEGPLPSFPFDIRPAGPGTIAGRTQTPDGKGIGGLFVMLDSPEDGFQWTTTAADGAFRFVGLNDAAVRVEVFAEDSAGGVKYTAPTTQFDLRVPVAAGQPGSQTNPLLIPFIPLAPLDSVLKGTVTGPAGAEVEILASSASDIFWAGVTLSSVPGSEATGSAEYSILLPGGATYSVGVWPPFPLIGTPQPPDYVVPESVEVPVATGTLTAQDFTLVPANRTIQGSVAVGATGLPDAFVYAYEPVNNGVWVFGMTDEQGEFRLKVPEGSFNVGAFVPGRPWLPDVPVAVTAAEQAPAPAQLIFTLPEADRTITGRVVSGANGTPVPEVAVLAYQIDANGTTLPDYAFALTDLDGNFTIFVPSGSTWQLQAIVEDIGATPPVTVSADDPAASDVRLALGTTVTLTGQVRQHNTPVGKAVVSAEATGGTPLGGSTVTDDKGNFTLKLLVPPAEETYGWDIHATLPGVGSLAPQPVTVDSQGTLTPAALTFNASASGTLAVTFVDSSNAPLTVAEAFVNVSSATFQGAGKRVAGARTVTFSVPAGVYTVEAGVPGFAYVRQSAVEVLADATTSVSLTLTKQEVQIAGVVRSTDGRKLAGALVSVSGLSSRFGKNTYTDSNGAYLLTVPEHDQYQVRATATGFLPLATSQNPTNITVGSAGIPLDFTLQPEMVGTTSVSGTVAQSDGAGNITGTAQGNASVTATNTASGQSATTTVDAQGRYTLRLGPGDWTLRAVADGYETTAVGPCIVTQANPCTVTLPGAPAPLALTLSPIPGFQAKRPVQQQVPTDTASAVVDRTSGVQLSIPAGAFGREAASGNLPQVKAAVAARAPQPLQPLPQSLLAGSPSARAGAFPLWAGQVSANQRTRRQAAQAPDTTPAGSITISIKETTDAPSTANMTPLGGKAKNITAVHSTGRPVTNLAAEMTITVDYRAEAVGLTQDEKERLQLGYFDAKVGNWVIIPSTNDTTNHRMTASTKHLTKFSVLSTSTTAVPTLPAPDETSSNGGGGGGGGGGSGSSAPPGPPSATTTVSTTAGGAITLEGITVSIAAGATTTAGDLTVKVTSSSIPATAPLPAGCWPGSRVFTIDLVASGAPGQPPDQGLELTVPFGDADLRLAGGDPARLRLSRYDEASRTWQDLDTTADPATRTLKATTTRTSLFAIMAELPMPTALAGPPGGIVFGLGTSLAWSNPPETAQYQVQLLPFNSDGPAINLIIGRRDLVQAARFPIPAPVLGHGNYLMLPGMTYTWRVRTSPLTTALQEGDPGWSAYATGVPFRTAVPTSATITPVRPMPGGSVASLTPTLHWADANPSIFYYEVQLSADPAFNADPVTATAAVYWNLVHGGVTDPLNSWAVPPSFALDGGTTYYWRVRPRVQGDGTPVAWSDTWSFHVPPAAVTASPPRAP